MQVLIRKKRRRELTCVTSGNVQAMCSCYS
jgi:hypothetical protein